MMPASIIPPRRRRLAQLAARNRHGVLTKQEEAEWRALVGKEGYEEARTLGLDQLHVLSLGIMAADIWMGEIEA